MKAATQKHAPAAVDVSTLDYDRYKVRCQECRGLKSTLFATTSRGNICSIWLSRRPGKKGR